MGAHMSGSTSIFSRLLRYLLVLALTVAALGLGAQQLVKALANAELQLQAGQTLATVVVEPRATARQVARDITQAGVNVPEWALYAWFRWSGQSRQIQAGTYEFAPPISAQGVLNKLVRGEQATARVTLIEGWTFAQVRQALRDAPDLKPTTAGWSEAQIMAALQMHGVHPEGRFFPDTYIYPKNSDDLAVFRQAALAMQRKLRAAWGQHNNRTALESAEELLILASMIEKETQQSADRAMVSAVFHNRLRIGMRLQSDPTIIYGLGDAFDGDLKRVHLRTDGPYNSYTRRGLPPTPIAMPSAASLAAAAMPAETKALYFVGKGDGSSHFSDTLREHNGAVRRYILKR